MRSLVIVSAVLLGVNASPPVKQEKCGVPSGRSTYVIGGSEALPLEFPWQVSLQLNFLNRWFHNCGGSIIDKNWILTAAHCVDPRIVPPRIPLRALLGAHRLNRSEKSASSHLLSQTDIHAHPMWSLEHLDYDYALIQLPEPLDFAGNHSHLTPICLPQADDNFENTACVISGWGYTTKIGFSSDVLQKLPARVTPQDDCIKMYDSYKPAPAAGSIHITPRHICAVSSRGDGSGPCKGDSGGPLQCEISGRYVLAGATSFTEECGSVRYPGVYARISEVLPWIEQVIANSTRG